MQKQTLYTKLMTEYKTLKAAQALALLDVSIEVNWGGATTVLGNDINGNLALTVSDDVMTALTEYNTMKKMDNSFPTVSAMFFRLALATKVKAGSINRASKLPVSGWFAFTYEELGDYYDVVSSVFAQKQAQEV